MYSIEQISTVSQYLKNKFFIGEIESLELITTLIAMNRAKKITEENMAEILIDVYIGNVKAIHEVLKKASRIIEEKDIDEIIANIKAREAKH